MMCIWLNLVAAYQLSCLTELVMASQQALDELLHKSYRGTPQGMVNLLTKVLLMAEVN